MKGGTFLIVSTAKVNKSPDDSNASKRNVDEFKGHADGQNDVQKTQKPSDNSSKLHAIL